MSLTLNPTYTVSGFNGPSPPQTQCLASFQINSSGDIKQIINGGTITDIGDWLSPKSGMSGYEVMATVISGTLYSGTVGSWLDCSLNHDWTVRDTTKAGGAVVASITVQIREKANHANIDSTTVSLSASLFG